LNAAHNILGKEIFKKTISLEALLQTIKNTGLALASKYKGQLFSGRLKGEDYNQRKRKGDDSEVEENTPQPCDSTNLIASGDEEAVTTRVNKRARTALLIEDQEKVDEDEDYESYTQDDPNEDELESLREDDIISDESWEVLLSKIPQNSSRIYVVGMISNKDQRRLLSKVQQVIIFNSM
jgi:hypothetical protein